MTVRCGDTLSLSGVSTMVFEGEFEM